MTPTPPIQQHRYRTRPGDSRSESIYALAASQAANLASSASWFGKHTAERYDAGLLSIEDVAKLLSIVDGGRWPSEATVYRRLKQWREIGQLPLETPKRGKR